MTFVAGVVGFLTLGRRQQVTQPASATQASTTAVAVPPSAVFATATPSSAAPASSSVTVNLSTIPADASLFLDGHPLPANPYSARLPPDGGTHVVRAEATGYQVRTVTLTADHDTDVILALDATRLTRGALKHSPAPIVASAPAPSASAKSNNCSPPYFIGADGIEPGFAPSVWGSRAVFLETEDAPTAPRRPTLDGRVSSLYPPRLAYYVDQGIKFEPQGL